MERALRLVGWTDEQQWRAVMAGLLSADPRDMRAALAAVDAWRVRSRLPLAVEVYPQREIIRHNTKEGRR